jgi:hypothetical protein
LVTAAAGCRQKFLLARLIAAGTAARSSNAVFRKLSELPATYSTSGLHAIQLQRRW